jgi:mRNA-degrading endonuclease YafQ of YafQ-DinJ toxin-antitoxin module
MLSKLVASFLNCKKVIYKLDSNTLKLARIGSHSDLFR